MQAALHVAGPDHADRSSLRAVPARRLVACTLVGPQRTLIAAATASHPAPTASLLTAAAAGRPGAPRPARPGLRLASPAPRGPAPRRANPGPAETAPAPDVRPGGADSARARDSEPPPARADFDFCFRSQPEEHDYVFGADDIVGSLPPELEGTYFRNGPGTFEARNGAPIHPFDGDGLIVRVAIRRGRAHFRSRYVRTPGREAERRAGRVLFRKTFGTQRPGGPLMNALDTFYMSPGNTNVVFWGGKLWAMWEGLRPHVLDPVTLDTLGEEHLGGELRPGLPFTVGSALGDLLAGLLSAGPVVGHTDQPAPRYGGHALGAHVRLDAPAGRLVAFAHRTVLGLRMDPRKPLYGTQLTFLELDAAGRVAAATEAPQMPGFNLLHDFGLTDRYYIVFQSPANVQLAPFLAGVHPLASCLSWDAAAPTLIHLIPRPLVPPGAGAGVPPVRAAPGPGVITLRAPPGFHLHHVSAWDEGPGRVVIDTVRLAVPGPQALVRLGTADDFYGPHARTAAALAAAAAVSGGAAAAGPSCLWRYELTLPPPGPGPGALAPAAAIAAAIGGAGAPGAVRAAPLLGARTVEFPRAQPAYGRHRFVYAAASRHSSRHQPLQAWIKYDTASGAVQEWDAGPRCFVGEPEYVPRPRAPAARDPDIDPSPSAAPPMATPVAAAADATSNSNSDRQIGDADPGDRGWLVGFVIDAALGRSRFVVLDACNLSKGPVAELRTRASLPLGFHGNWAAQYFGPPDL